MFLFLVLLYVLCDFFPAWINYKYWKIFKFLLPNTFPIKHTIWEISLHLINNPRMFNGAIVDLAEKPYIPQKILLQWVCCKCLAGCNRHIYFWHQRSWRLLEAKNTPQRPKSSWRSWLIEKVFNESFSAPSKTPWWVQSDLSYDLRVAMIFEVIEVTEAYTARAQSA